MRILCCGDSNTYGYDPRGFLGGRYDAGDRWVDLVAAATGHTMVQDGVNGREIPGFDDALRLAEECGGTELLLVMLGTNDLLQGLSAGEAVGKMEVFLTPLLARGMEILLVSPPAMRPGVWVTEALAAESLRLGEEYRCLAKRLEIPFVDAHRWALPLCFDGVHLTEAAHHHFAAALLPYLPDRPA